MVTLDFSRIRSEPKGQSHSFEELVCQLARRENVPTGSQFRRVEGAGGDGGIEGYWLLPNGEKIGYQAKFFLKSGDINWRQIDESVQQALGTHPELVRYIVALPCNLTDRAGKRQRGKTGWQQWQAHQAMWAQHRAGPNQLQVEFIPWTAAEITDQLTRPDAEGLRWYWFNEVEFSADWFKRQVEQSIAALDERYQPEDHVEVRLANLFKFITRHGKAASILRDKVAEVTQVGTPAPLPEALRSAEYLTTAEEVSAALHEIRAIAGDLDLPRSEGWSPERWKSAASKALSAARKLYKHLSELSYQPKKGQQPPHDQDGNRSGSDQQKEALNWSHRRTYRLIEAIQELENALTNNFMRAEASRSALMKGRAGSGKSHLLGDAAQQAVTEGRPVIFLLGQQFNQSPVWNQIISRLELNGLTSDGFLQALNAAGQAVGTRALILIDALNEGAGASVWRSEITAFLARIKHYEYVACVVSCRTEYINSIFSENILADIESFNVVGFETQEEQRAAAEVYLDRKGITRPSTPWIAPEFVNPLFLRTVCQSLRREGLTEFPKGLTGTKAVIAYYLASVARSLGVELGGRDKLVHPTKTAISQLAHAMAAKRADFLSWDDASRIINDTFQHHPAPAQKTWLQVLVQNGLLRLDPPAEIDPADPMAANPDVIRFSFQRFQDHFMAEALLKGVNDVPSAFLKDGALKFLLRNNEVDWNWAGLVEALSIQIPERFEIELVDALPGGSSYWQHDNVIIDAFAESIKWRDKAAFFDQTFAMLNRLGETHVEAFDLVLQVSANSKHRLNAEKLHKNLINMKMPARDAWWTVYVNRSSSDSDSVIGRLLDWTINAKLGQADPEASRLCAIVLCWLFTSSNRVIRDTATKALVNLLLNDPPLLTALCDMFAGIDDIYVKERLVAAAYGAACIDPSPERLRSYGQVVYAFLFKVGEAPLSLKLRDYGRGIIELAKAKGCLLPDVDYERCIPPYGASPPKLSVSEAELEAVAKRVGGEEILHSCHHFRGDFGIYTIKYAISDFTSVSLRRPAPVSRQQLFDRFVQEVVDPCEQRRAALHAIRTEKIPILIRHSRGDNRDLNEEHDDFDILDGVASGSVGSDEALLNLLSRTERARYRAEAREYLGFGPQRERRDLPRFDFANAGRWVAKRAYSLGWKSKLFPRDSSGDSDYSRLRPFRERIGKKYQWIALDELLCRMADNFWVNDGYGLSGKKYENIWDLGGIRDIDPTISSDIWAPLTANSSKKEGDGQQDYRLSTVSETDLTDWPFRSDPGDEFREILRHQDDNGAEWIKLYEHRSITEKYEPERRGLHGTRRQKFHILTCVIIRKEQAQVLLDQLANVAHVEVHDWDRTLGFGNDIFLRELLLRSAAHPQQWQAHDWRTPNGIQIAYPVCNYSWEDRQDTSLAKSRSALLPAPWLAGALRISQVGREDFKYLDDHGTEVFRGKKFPDHGSQVLVSKTVLEGYLKENGLTCFWVVIAERNAWPDGDNTNAAWRRSEGCAFFKGNRFMVKTWKRDQCN